MIKLPSRQTRTVQERGRTPVGLYLVDGRGRKLKQLLGSARVHSLRWSPQGDLLAWGASSYGGGAGMLNLVSNQEIDSPPVGRPSMVDFSADGRMLALAGPEGMFLHDVTTGQSHRTFGGSGTIAWSPSGGRLMINQWIGGHRTSLLSVYDQRYSEVSILAVTFENATWSADGERIAYSSDGCTSDGWDIHTVRYDRTGRVRLTDTPRVMKSGVRWSPASDHIAFGTFDKLMLVDVNGKAEILVTRSQQLITPLVPLSWSPGGRYLVFWTDPGHGVC